MEEQQGSPVADEGLVAHYSSTANATLCDAAQLCEAQLHGKASGVYPLEPADILRIREEDRCPCCFFPHNHTTKFSLRNVDALRGLGLGFPFLFYLSGYLIAMMCIIFAVAALPCLIGNLIAEDKYGQESGIAASSLGGMKAGEMEGYWPAILNLIALVLVCVCYSLVTLHLRYHTKRLNQGIVTPPDFTVVIKNLGPDFDPEQLKRHLEIPISTAKWMWGSLTTQVQVEKCDISYDIRDYTAILSLMQGLTMSKNTSQPPFKSKEMFCRCLLGCCFRKSMVLYRAAECK